MGEGSRPSALRAKAGDVVAGLVVLALLGFGLLLVRQDIGRLDGMDRSQVAADLRAGIFSSGLLGVRTVAVPPRAAEDVGERASPGAASGVAKPAARDRAAEPKSADMRPAPGALRSSLRNAHVSQSASFTGRDLLAVGLALAFAAMGAVTLGVRRQYRRAVAPIRRTGRRN